MKNFNIDIVTLEQFSVFLFPLIEGGPRVIDDGGCSSVDRSSNNTGGADNDYNDRPDKDPKPDDVEKMKDAMNTNGDAATPNTETQEEESVFDKIKDWVKEKYEEGKAKVAEERAQQKAEEAAMMEKLANRNQQNQQRLNDKAETLREEARNSSGVEAERLNNEADFWEERAETYGNRSEALNGYKEKLGKKADKLKAEAETIRGEHDKKETYAGDALTADQIRVGSPAAGVDAATMGDLFSRVYSSDFIEQPVEETASYDPQLDEAIANTAASVNGQSYSEITIDPMEIKPLAHLDYPKTGIDPGFQNPTAPTPKPVEPMTITMPAEEGFSFQQMAASTLEPVQITTTTPEAGEIPGLPQGAVVLDTANQEVPLPSDSTATGGYYQIPAFREYQETGNFFTDMANLPYNKVCRALNTAVDIVNMPIHDVQYIGEHGWRAYGEAALEANINGFKQLGYSLMDTAQSGMDFLREAPKQVMDYFVFKDPGEILADTYTYCKDSLTSVEAWDQAIDMVLGAVVFKNVGGVTDDVAISLAPKSGSVKLRVDFPSKTPTMSTEEMARWERYLNKRNVEIKYGQEIMLDDLGAEALYDPKKKTIYLRTNPSRSSFFEEAFHARQDIRGVPDFMEYKGRIIDRWEFEAQRSLIRNRHRLGIPNDQTRQTILNLREVYNGEY